MSVLPGTAAVKAEYLISSELAPVPNDDGTENSKSLLVNGRGGCHDSENPKDTAMFRRKSSKDERRAQRGQNKGRKFGKIRDELELCWRIANGTSCEFGAECRFTHDIPRYLAAKPRDIHYEPSATLGSVPPYVELTAGSTIGVGAEYSSVDFSTTCPIFDERGECRHGLKCRFLGGHVRKDDRGGLVLLQDEDKKARKAISALEVNFTTQEVLKTLRSRKYPHPRSDAFLREVELLGDHWSPSKQLHIPSSEGGDSMSVTFAEPEQSVDVSATVHVEADPLVTKRTGGLVSQEDTPDVPVRFAEKKRLDWAGKLYLAPLTTVGNLPFRRLCVAYGADITCGEMGLATSFLAGSKEEWSLVRRHPSESTFGVQIAGNKPYSLVPAVEVIASECAGNVDFVDLNCGCPIDLVFKNGSGSALLDAAGKLGKIVVGMNRALGEIPVTVKLRAGVKDGRNNAHKLMPRLSAEWGAGCITLHGRTRQQRYTRLADWDYIKQCVNAVRARELEEDLPPVPIFGGGDCFSAEDYWSKVETSGVDGVMIGRGALIKPWIFTEIKERREWDISSKERLEGIRQYAEFGLNHFGSDTAGVNTTRRYLCEALSFQYRYIPIGLLEQLPGRINDRAPAFRGRDQLETLLASADSRDWVKISEMFLGPAPASWAFTPKHKSNAYGSEESQG